MDERMVKQTSETSYESIAAGQARHHEFLMDEERKQWIQRQKGRRMVIGRELSPSQNFTGFWRRNRLPGTVEMFNS